MIKPQIWALNILMSVKHLKMRLEFHENHSVLFLRYKCFEILMQNERLWIITLHFRPTSGFLLDLLGNSKQLKKAYSKQRWDKTISPQLWVAFQCLRLTPWGLAWQNGKLLPTFIENLKALKLLVCMTIWFTICPFDSNTL